MSTSSATICLLLSSPKYRRPLDENVMWERKVYAITSAKVAAPTMAMNSHFCLSRLKRRRPSTESSGYGMSLAGGNEGFFIETGKCRRLTPLQKDHRPAIGVIVHEAFPQGHRENRQVEKVGPIRDVVKVTFDAPAEGR